MIKKYQNPTITLSHFHLGFYTLPRDVIAHLWLQRLGFFYPVIKDMQIKLHRCLFLRVYFLLFVFRN